MQSNELDSLMDLLLENQGTGLNIRKIITNEPLNELHKWIWHHISTQNLKALG